jgi:hypothetical protein
MLRQVVHVVTIVPRHRKEVCNNESRTTYTSNLMYFKVLNSRNFSSVTISDISLSSFPTLRVLFVLLWCMKTWIWLIWPEDGASGCSCEQGNLGFAFHTRRWISCLPKRPSVIFRRNAICRVAVEELIHAFGKSLCTYKMCWKWCPRASIQAWTRLILFANTFCRSAYEMFLMNAVITVFNSLSKLQWQLRYWQPNLRTVA